MKLKQVELCEHLFKDGARPEKIEKLLSENSTILTEPDDWGFSPFLLFCWLSSLTANAEIKANLACIRIQPQSNTAFAPLARIQEQINTLCPLKPECLKNVIPVLQTKVKSYAEMNYFSPQVVFFHQCVNALVNTNFGSIDTATQEMLEALKTELEPLNKRMKETTELSARHSTTSRAAHYTSLGLRRSGGGITPNRGRLFSSGGHAAASHSTPELDQLIEIPSSHGTHSAPEIDALTREAIRLSIQQGLDNVHSSTPAAVAAAQTADPTEARTAPTSSATPVAKQSQQHRRGC